MTLRLATAAVSDWAEIEGRMIRDGIRDPFALSLRQWLNVCWSYLLDIHGAQPVSVERIPIVAGTELIPVGSTAGERAGNLARYIETGSHEAIPARTAMTKSEAAQAAKAAPKVDLAALEVMAGGINGVRGVGSVEQADQSHEERGHLLPGDEITR